MCKRAFVAPMLLAATKAADISLQALLTRLSLNATITPAIMEQLGITTACDFSFLTERDLSAPPLSFNLVQTRKLQTALSTMGCTAGRVGAGNVTGPPLRTFGCIHSEPFLVNSTEFTICAYNSSTPAAITHLQFTFTYGQYGQDAADVYFRAYVDDEVDSGVPGIDVQMEQGMFAVETPQSPDASAVRVGAPWGNARIGRGSNGGGRYFNFRIPFQSRIRLTVYSKDPASTCHCFTIIRGAEGAETTAGGLTLPVGSRLHVSPVFGATVDQWAKLVALNTTGGPGVLAMWSLFVYESTMGLTYLEGCQRAVIDGQLVPVGDGEDFFDSGWYFDAGLYVFPQAGLLERGNSSTFAYRIFDSDPIVWQSSMNLTWRNDDTYPKCVDDGDSPPPNPSNSVGVTSHVWWYSWGW